VEKAEATAEKKKKVPALIPIARSHDGSNEKSC
jgi:hypothetical protein